MPGKETMPNGTADILSFSNTFAAKLRQHKDIIGISDQEIDDLIADNNTLNESIQAVNEARCIYHCAVAKKRAGRANTENRLRELMRKVKANPDVSSEIFVDLGMKNPYNDSPNYYGRHDETPLLLPSCFPGRVTIKFRMEEHKGSRACKPHWAKGCIFYRKRKSEDTFTMIGIAAKSPFVDEVRGGVDEYTYIARYFGSGQKDFGPESQSVIVAARGVIAA